MPSLFAAAAFAAGANLALAAPGAFLAAEPAAAPAPAPAAAAAAEFDCAADFADWSHSWATPKKVWCCAAVGRGCADAAATTSSGTFDCAAAFAAWSTEWSEAKQGWCCEHAGKGCGKDAVSSQPIALNAVDPEGAVDTKAAAKTQSSKWIMSTSEDPEDDKVRNPEDDKAEEALLDALLAANVTLSPLSRSSGGDSPTASSAACTGVGASVVNGLSPGCLERCEGTGICAAIQQAVDAYLPSRDVNAVGHILCQQYTSTRCLVAPEQHQVCNNALNSIRAFGFPTSVEELEARCGRQAASP